MDSFSVFLHYINTNGFLCMLLLLGLIVLKKYRHFTSGFLSLTVTFIIVQFLKHFVDRPRPFVELDVVPKVLETPYSSFPSGHVSSLAAISVVFWMYYPRLRWLVVCSVLAMMWSRMYLLMHHFSDVLVGLIIGVLVGILIEWLLKRRS